MAEFQTRQYNGETIQHSSAKLAFDFARKHPDVWKVSFNAEDNGRIRLVRSQKDPNAWIYDPLINGGTVGIDNLVEEFTVTISRNSIKLVNGVMHKGLFCTCGWIGSSVVYQSEAKAKHHILYTHGGGNISYFGTITKI